MFPDETVRRWALKFGQACARLLQDNAPSTGRPVAPQIEVFVSIAGKRMYPWRAVDGEGEGAGYPGSVTPEQAGSIQIDAQTGENARFVTGRLPSCGAALKDLRLARDHDVGGRKNNRAHELPLAGPTAGTTNAAFQIGSISAAVSLYPRNRLQHLQPPTPSDFPKNVTPVSSPRNGPVRCRVSLRSMPFRGMAVQ